jgi:hypothetical protein
VGNLVGANGRVGDSVSHAPGFDPAQRCLALRSDNTALPGFIARLPTAPARGAR